MKVLVFGTTGQVAIELARHVPDGIDLCSLGRTTADLTDPQACRRAIERSNADLVINAAAYTAVDAAENDERTAYLVNTAAPEAMANAAVGQGIPFLHVSTDYVFDGSGQRPWKETDSVNPLGVYARTKLDGEIAVQKAGGAFAILRTSWVFSAHGKNFVKTMLRLGQERTELSIVDDQRGGPTPASEIAKALWKIATALNSGTGQAGIFHFSGTPAVSWADFAEAIFGRSSLPVRPAVKRILTSGFPTPARRPLNSALDCSRIRLTYGIEQPDWRTGLSEVIKELEATP